MSVWKTCQVIRDEMKKNYQFNYSENQVAKDKLYRQEERVRKAEMMFAVLSDYFPSTAGLKVLDMSCSTGITTRALANYFPEITGIDIDETALEYARGQGSVDNICYLNMDAMNTDFRDGSFDIIICNQMYEHVPDPVRLFCEIRRLLSENGVCYFGATSRLKVIETHYGRIPFLSYLPKNVANLYLRILGKGDEYYETLFSYWGLKNLVSGFEVSDYTLNIIRDPEKYSAEDLVGHGRLRRRVAPLLATYAYKLLPGYVWLLKKKD